MHTQITALFVLNHTQNNICIFEHTDHCHIFPLAQKCILFPAISLFSSMLELVLLKQVGQSSF